VRIVIGLPLICLAVLLAVGGLVLVQRLMPARRRLRNNYVAGFIYAVLGNAYAVLLGLVVVAVWEEWNAATAAADQEASDVAEVFFLLNRIRSLPESHYIGYWCLSTSTSRAFVWCLRMRGHPVGPGAVGRATAELGGLPCGLGGPCGLGLPPRPPSRRGHPR
jgi:hypothetical protein